MAENLLLAGLPRVLQVRLAQLTEHVWLSGGTHLFRIGDVVQHVYFPTGALVSLIGLTSEGEAVELATVAKDGVVGLPVLLNAAAASHDATVRLAGGALRLSAPALRAELGLHESLRLAVLEYATRSASEFAQAIVCQCFHHVRQRMCRWLLTAADCTETDTLVLTQEGLAQALGVARPVVTKAALELQDSGAIRYRYGRLVIVNRSVLERSACECYRIGRT